MGTTLKIILAVVLTLVLSGILLVAGYFIYVAAQYSRIEDNQTLAVENNQEQKVKIGESLSAITFNIGFGAYDQDFSFFLDEGRDKETGKKQVGKHGKGISHDNTLKNTNGSLKTIEDNIADFVFVQEMDTDGTRSYHINQYDIFKESSVLSKYSRVYAQNYHSAFLMFPITDPIGANESGIALFSKYKIDSSVRKSYPLDTGFDKYFDLDRCFSLNRLPIEGSDKQLVIINSHMSAYDEGGKIRAKQLALLNQVMQAEYDKGNYVVVGGDFNHDLIGALGEQIDDFATTQAYPEWISQLSDKDINANFNIVAAHNAGTCRAAEIPYQKGVNYETVVDGFIVSDNIQVLEVRNIGEHEYKYSDHNPSRMEFVLK